MSQYVKIKNTEFVRDMQTKAVLNTDSQSLVDFERMRSKILSEKRNAQETKLRLEQLEHDMAELKIMLSDMKRLKEHP